jgi:hypothetical protein
VLSFHTYPCVSLVAPRKLLPQRNGSVLELDVLPEQRTMHAGIRMPINVLATWSSVQVEDCVYTVRPELGYLSWAILRRYWPAYDVNDSV